MKKIVRAIEHTIEVNVSASDVYNKLCDVEEYPRFLQDIRQVKRVDATHFQCDGKAFGNDRQWNVEITTHAPGKYMVWRNSEGIVESGRVELQDIGNAKTHIRLLLDCNECDGASQALIRERAERDLARFKACMENDAVQWNQNEGDEMREMNAMSGKNELESKLENDPKNECPSDGSHFGYSGPDGSDGQDRSAASSYYSAGAGGWDGNEDPGSIVLSGKNADKLSDTDRDTYAVDAPEQWAPSLEVSQQNSQVTISAALPGVTSENVQVEILSGKLVIEGDRPLNSDVSGLPHIDEENLSRHFYQEVALPDGADADAAVASMRDGMLEITVPISQAEKQARRLDIRSL